MKNKVFSFLFIVSIAGLLGCQGVDSLSSHRAKLRQVDSWAILLDYEPQRENLTTRAGAYDLVILDPDNHPPLKELPDSTLKIAYLSVGEAENYRAYWSQMWNAPWVLEENPHWKGNFLVDVRHPQWRRLILEKVIPGILDQGFDGVMLDTIDTAESLEDLDPERYAGMGQAMAELIQEIQTRFPQLMLISNNGFMILERIAASLSALLAEDLYGMVNFETGGYNDVAEPVRAEKVRVLTAMSRRYQLPVFIIDYVDAANREKAATYQKAVHALGFKSYIAEKNLDRFYEQPL